MKAILGDKVRVKKSRVRGVVEKLHDQQILVRLETSILISVSEDEITNYSLAARKAWQNMPDRSVGRPKGTTTTDRVSVTLRIDRSTWETFKLAERNGCIADRTLTINQWLAEKVSELLRQFQGGNLGTKLSN